MTRKGGICTTSVTGTDFNVSRSNGTDSFGGLVLAASSSTAEATRSSSSNSSASAGDCSSYSDGDWGSIGSGRTSDSSASWEVVAFYGVSCLTVATSYRSLYSLVSKPYA